MDTAGLTERFNALGFVELPSLVTDPNDWAERILRSPSLHQVFTPEKDRLVAAGKGDLKHRTIDRWQTDECIPQFEDFYLQTLEQIQPLVSVALMASPYSRSAYYCKAYDPPEGQQGWHFDTNDVTVVLYLTTNEESGGTEVQALDGSTTVVQPRAGNLLLMRGRECWHRAQPVASGIKVTALLNYYGTDPEPRDSRLDPIIFGS